MRIDGDALLVDWEFSRALDPALHSFVVTIDDCYQVGVKMVDGAEVVTYVTDLTGATSEYRDSSGATDGEGAELEVSLAELEGVDGDSVWRAAATEKGVDVGRCPAAAAPIGG